MCCATSSLPLFFKYAVMPVARKVWFPVVQDDRLRPPDRDMLANDFDRVRDFRNRHREFGAR